MSTKNIFLLSLAVIGITVTVLIFVASKIMFTPSDGAWFIAYPLATDGMKNISNEPYEFKLGNMSCGVPKTQFVRGSDGSRIVTRELYCWTSEDTYVSTTVNCNIPEYTVQALTIKKKNNSYLPALMCGPEKKGPIHDAPVGTVK